MKLPEMWEDLVSGKWITRKAWKKGYAVRLCNLKAKPEHPILMEDTYGYLFHFGGMQSDRVLKRTAPGGILHFGLQHDLLAEDWSVADQTNCDMVLKEHEK